MKLQHNPFYYESFLGIINKKDEVRGPDMAQFNVCDNYSCSRCPVGE